MSPQRTESPRESHVTNRRANAYRNQSRMSPLRTESPPESHVTTAYRMTVRETAFVPHSPM